MSDEEALQVAERMRPFHRSVILLCSRTKSWGYGGMAEKLGSTYDEVQAVGRWLQKKKLATIGFIRHGSEFGGSGLILNERGEHVRLAADLITRKTRAPDR